MLFYARFGWKKKKVYGNKSKSVEENVESVVRTVSEWVCRREEFIGVSLEDLNRSWAAF